MRITPKIRKELKSKFPEAIKELEAEMGLNINIERGVRNTGKSITLVIKATPKDEYQFKTADMEVIEGNRTEQIIDLIGKGVTRSSDIARKIGTNHNYVNTVIRSLKLKGLLSIAVIIILSSCSIFKPANSQPIEKISGTIDLYSSEDTIQLLDYHKDKLAWSLFHKTTGLIEFKYNWMMDGAKWTNDTTIYKTTYATDGLYKIEFKRDTVWYILGK